jgi:hypothetical protein
MVESADSKVAIHFSRRYGFWLAIMSALYSIKEWPDGEYASWGRKLLDQEFCGSLEAAQRYVVTIYNEDKKYFGANPAIEDLMAAVTLVVPTK